LTFKSEGHVFSSITLSRPILSNYPAQPGGLLTNLQTAIAGLGAIALVISFPQVLIVPLIYLIAWAKDDFSNCVSGVIVLVSGILLVCCPLVWFSPGLRQSLMDNIATPTPTIAIPNPTPLPDHEKYYAYIDIKAPPNLEQGQSQIVKLEFTLLDKYVPEAIPVYLKKSSSYKASVDIQLTSFDLASQSEEILQNRNVRLNDPIEWTWVILPKKDAEGRQAIAWTVAIQDGSDASSSNLPTVYADLKIKPKLGVPSWLFGANWSMVTTAVMLGGLFSTFYSFKKKAEEKQIGKKRTNRITSR
jgi:hypothetical protein